MKEDPELVCLETFCLPHNKRGSQVITLSRYITEYQVPLFDNVIRIEYSTGQAPDV